jgi:beta-glucosidase
MLLSHAAAYHLYKEKYFNEQKGEVGICLDTNYYYPLNSNVTQDTIDKSVNFKFGWFAHSIFSTEGGYPPVLREAIDTKSKNEGRRWSRLPEFTPQQRSSLINSADFLAINYYTSRLVIPYKDNAGTEDWTSDSDIFETVDIRWEQGLSDWLFSVPRGIRDQLVWIKNHYNNPRVFISETGWSDPGTLEDFDRIRFYEKHLAAVIDAATVDGCRVEAFTAWSMTIFFRKPC